MKTMSNKDYRDAVRFLRMFSRDDVPQGLRGANARRLAGCLVRKLERNERRSDADKLIMYNVLFVNDIACGCLVEALGLLRRSSYYRQDVKRRVSQIERWRRLYEVKIKHIVGQYGDSYMEMCDAYTESLRHDNEVFFLSFKQAYDKERMQDAALLSRLQLARWWAELAGFVYLDRLRPEIVRGRRYTYLDFRPLARMLGQLIHSHFPASDAVSCEDGHTAATILVKRISEGERIADAINAAG